MVVGVGLAEIDELIPRDAQYVGVVRHVLAQHLLGECIVAGRHGSMGSEERRAAHDLQCLRERQALLSYEIAYALDADECCVTLVAVVYLLFDAHLDQGADTAHA